MIFKYIESTRLLFSMEVGFAHRPRGSGRQSCQCVMLPQNYTQDKFENDVNVHTSFAIMRVYSYRSDELLCHISCAGHVFLQGCFILG